MLLIPPKIRLNIAYEVRTLTFISHRIAHSSFESIWEFIAKSINLINSFPLFFQIASHSKSSTKSRFWNRSFHILSCDHVMEASEIIAPLSETRPSIARDNSTNSENSKCRLDRKLLNGEFSLSKRNWQQSFLVPVIIVLLNLTSSIECLQARQEGTYTNPYLHSV